MADITKGTPLQLSHSALYSLSYTSKQYDIATCFSPVDLQGCYSDNAEDTTLVYCLYTFADSLRNPAVRKAVVFHNIGLDRIAYNPWRAIRVNISKSYTACPGAQPSFNMDDVPLGVAVRARVEMTGIRFRNSFVTSYKVRRALAPGLEPLYPLVRALLHHGEDCGAVSYAATGRCLAIVTSEHAARTVQGMRWGPGNSSMLPGIFDVGGSGSLVLNNCTIEVPRLADTVRTLQALPGERAVGHSALTRPQAGPESAHRQRHTQRVCTAVLRLPPCAQAWMRPTPRARGCVPAWTRGPRRRRWPRPPPPWRPPPRPVAAARRSATRGCSRRRRSRP